MAIFGLTNSAFDGELLVELIDFRLEIHPSAVQAIIYGRPQSDYCQFGGLTEDGWLVFDLSDDIRQELVDLLAGMAGRVRVVGPDELRDLVADRIQEIASTVG
jgi:predicted DNA-binding transcriptional regulator YafY